MGLFFFSLLWCAYFPNMTFSLLAVYQPYDFCHLDASPEEIKESIVLGRQQTTQVRSPPGYMLHPAASMYTILTLPLLFSFRCVLFGFLFCVSFVLFFFAVELVWGLYLPIPCATSTLVPDQCFVKTPSAQPHVACFAVGHSSGKGGPPHPST